MAASFPNSVKNFTVKIDGFDDVMAEHINSLQDEVMAIENYLLSGWAAAVDAWEYVSATSFRVSGDKRTMFPTGTKIKLTQTGTTKYFYAINASYSAPNTTVTITGGSNYSLANAAITDAYYSYANIPQGFPGWFNWTPTYSGSGSMTYTSVTTHRARFRLDGSSCTIQLRANGTTGGTADVEIRATLPFWSASYDQSLAGYVIDGAAAAYQAAIVRFSASNEIGVIKFDYSNWGIGSARWIQVNGTYEV